MITLKSPRELETMARAGYLVGQTLKRMRAMVAAGVSTLDLDDAAEAYIRSEGARPSFKGLYGFPKTLCTSINEEIVHGIPSAKRVFEPGDIVSVDVGVCVDGLHADAAITVSVGPPTDAVAHLLRITEASLERAILAVVLGNHVGDIGHAVQSYAEGEGLHVVRDLVGHGVGAKMHEDPQVPNIGHPKRGPRLKAGMTLAIEPMLAIGTSDTRTLTDKWTVVTADGTMSAHFEHTVAVTEDGPRVLTRG